MYNIVYTLSHTLTCVCVCTCIGCIAVYNTLPKQVQRTFTFQTQTHGARDLDTLGISAQPVVRRT